MNSFYNAANTATATIGVILFALLIGSCKPPGFINKVKYKGEKYINTCETFTNDIQKLIKENSNQSELRVSQYDNSDFDYYYLDPGQFEIKADTLYFRLVKDLKFAQYLYKGVAVHVNARYKVLDKVQYLDETTDGELGTLIIDEAYYNKHRKPFFIYKIPLTEPVLEGRQIFLSFGVVKYKKGELNKVFCNTIETPIGFALPACCNAMPWEATKIQSAVDFPTVDVPDETFYYAGFRSEIDLTFANGEFEYTDSIASITLKPYFDKIKELGFALESVDIKGYASPTGQEEKNRELSVKRAQKVKDAVVRITGVSPAAAKSSGLGEDWSRVTQALQSSAAISPTDRDKALKIISKDGTNDEKEAKLRKLGSWEVMKEQVMGKARHAFVSMSFKYAGDKMTMQRYEKMLPLDSKEIEKVAKTTTTATAYKKGINEGAELKKINTLLRDYAKANLYAMRATYHLGKNDVNTALEDLKKASQLDRANKQYPAAIQGYKLFFVDTYTFEERQALYEEYNKLAEQNPSDEDIFFNRAILMDKIWYVNGALNEYEKLFEGRNPTAANYNNRGVARLKANKLTAAENDFLKAIDMNDKLAEAYFNVAIIYSYRGLTTKTMDNLDKAIAIDEKFKELIFNNPAFSVMAEDPLFDKYKAR